MNQHALTAVFAGIPRFRARLEVVKLNQDLREDGVEIGDIFFGGIGGSWMHERLGVAFSFVEPACLEFLCYEQYCGRKCVRS